LGFENSIFGIGERGMRAPEQRRFFLRSREKIYQVLQQKSHSIRVLAMLEMNIYDVLKHRRISVSVF
jgi:hypothetical protein